MKSMKWFGTTAVLSTVSVLSTTAVLVSAISASNVTAADAAKGKLKEKPSPQASLWPYRAPGYSERDYDAWEAKFTFSVKCLPSDGAVYDAITSQSNRVLKLIETELPKPVFTEVERRYYDSTDYTVKNIFETDRVQFRSEPPQQIPDGNGGWKQTEGQSYWVDTCDHDRRLDPSRDNLKMGKVYEGTQTIGIRLPKEKAGRVEGMINTVNNKKNFPQDNRENTVKIYVQGPTPITTAATKLAMFNETRNTARALATGPGSQFQKDKARFKFAELFPSTEQVVPAPRYQPNPDVASDKALAPEFTLDAKYTYTVYANSRDLLNESGNLRPVSERFMVVGHATQKADYGVTTVGLSTQCHETKDGASDAIEKQSQAIIPELEKYDFKDRSSLKDKFQNNEATTPYKHYPYVAAEWKGGRVSAYMNLCSLQRVDARGKGFPQDLTPYWQSSRTLEIHSSDFVSLRAHAQALRAKWNVSTTLPTAVQVSVSKVTGALLNDSAAKLAETVRESATSCIIDPNGPVADAAKAKNFVCIFLKDLALGDLDVQVRPMESESFRGARMAAAAPPMSFDAKGGGATPQEPDLTLVEVKKPGQRARAVMTRWWEFRYEVSTQDLKHDFLPESKKAEPAKPVEQKIEKPAPKPLS